MITEHFGLKQNTISQIQTALAHYPQVEKAILYGSRARGNYKTGSDIDLTLQGENLTRAVLFRIMDEIDDLLLPYTFDLSLWQDITDEDVLSHIDRVGAIFYEKTGEVHHS
ncbi:MAG: nucleotidyltransferase domain-containing protein [Anaerolineales bacterium]|nr:nucleotidyltransferase domain-containing protein [Anaerolineales bacterium]